MSKQLILESTGLALVADSRVDADAGVIYGAKVLGSKSTNRRTYPAALLKQRFGIYEGAQVYADHDYTQLKTGRARPLGQWGGVIREVVYRGESVYGNVHCLKETPAGRIIMEAAQRCPDKFGLSPMHLIEATKGADGTETVTAILECWSVDAVTRPATTRTLFEEEQPNMPDVPEPSAVPSVEAAFLALQNAVMASSDYDDQEKVGILKDVMKLKSKVLGNGEEPADTPADTPADSPAGEAHNTPAPVGKTARLIAEMQTSIRGLVIRQMAGDLSIDNAAMQVLLNLPDDAAVAAYLDQLRRGRRPRYSPGPVRSSGRAVGESRDAPAPVPRLSKGADREAVKKFYRE